MFMYYIFAAEHINETLGFMDSSTNLGSHSQAMHVVQIPFKPGAKLVSVAQESISKLIDTKFQMFEYSFSNS